MTLATDIYITGTRVSQLEVFEKVNEILGIPSERIVREGPNEYDWEPGDYEIANVLGQGFPAIVETHSNRDGSLIVRADEDGEGETFHISVSLDTTYGYRDERGWDCSRLHAYVIVQLASWLHEHDCTVRWVNEYAGTVHDADDKEAFEKFLGNGDDASNWFINIAMPAIHRDLEKQTGAE